MSTPSPATGPARIARLMAVGIILLLSAALVPLARMQLGEKGWSLLQTDAGAAFWPLAALAALGAAQLMAYALWLHVRPRLVSLLVVIPCLMVLGGMSVGIVGVLQIAANPGPSSAEALSRLGGSLATPVWCLMLAAGLAAAGSVVLGSREFARARTPGVPWVPLFTTLLIITVINSWSSYARMAPRPLTATLVAAALLGPLLAAASWDQQDRPDWAPGSGATLITCGVLALAAGLAAAGADALVHRAAALYAQGPGLESHDHALALGGAHGTTRRLVSAGLVIGGTLCAITVTFWRFQDQLRPSTRRASLALTLALLLLALCFTVVAAHRVVLSRAVSQVNRLPAATIPARRRPQRGPEKARFEGGGNTRSGEYNSSTTKRTTAIDSRERMPCRNLTIGSPS